MVSSIGGGGVRGSGVGGGVEVKPRWERQG